MITKSQNLLRLLLLIPYVAWGIALLFVSLVNVSADILPTPNAFIDALTGVASFYTIGVVVWGIPYTTLTVGLLLWSINKPALAIYKMFVYSPFMLSVLMVVEIALILFWRPQARPFEDGMDFLSYILVAIFPTLIFGYGFVGMGNALYKAMRRINLVKIEENAK